MTLGTMAESAIVAIGGTGLLAQVSGTVGHATGDPSLLGIAASLGTQGLLIFMLQQSNAQRITREQAHAEEKTALAKEFADKVGTVQATQAEMNERLLSAVLGLVPPTAPEKGKR